MKIWQKWSIAIRVMQLAVLIAVLKFLSHMFGFDLMELNALFTSLVAGTISLIGFLISGVLPDYKESEKIPSEMGASTKTMIDNTFTIYKTKQSATALDFIIYQKSFLTSLMDWFYKKERTKSLLQKIGYMNVYFIAFDKEGVQANYILS